MKQNMYKRLSNANAPKNTSKYNHKEHEASSTTIPFGSRLAVKITDATPNRSSAEYKSKVEELYGAHSAHCGLAYYQKLVEQAYPVVDFSKKVKPETVEIEIPN